MKKLTSEILKNPKPISGSKEKRAKAILNESKSKLKNINGIVGFGIASNKGNPYIHILVQKGKGKKLEKLIPDKIGDVEVYYMEGSISLL